MMGARCEVEHNWRECWRDTCARERGCMEKLQAEPFTKPDMTDKPKSAHPQSEPCVVEQRSQIKPKCDHAAAMGLVKYYNAGEVELMPNLVACYSDLHTQLDAEKVSHIQTGHTLGAQLQSLTDRHKKLLELAETALTVLAAYGADIPALRAAIEEERKLGC